MADRPLMPKATAVWLVENTSLTFEQIADFCGLHVLEVKGIADGDVAHGIRGLDPITSGQLTREEIARAQRDPSYRLKLARSKVYIPEMRTKRAPKYTPVSRRHDRPNAILWLLRHHPELRDAQIMRLVGTTKTTIESRSASARIGIRPTSSRRTRWRWRCALRSTSTTRCRRRPSALKRRSPQPRCRPASRCSQPPTSPTSKTSKSGNKADSSQARIGVWEKHVILAHVHGHGH